MMHRLMFILLCFSLNTSAIAALYQYTDEQGNIVFSDSPISGGKRIKQNKPSVAPAPKRQFQPRTNKQQEEQSNQAKQKNKKAKRYKSVRIIKPENDKPLRSNNGDVSIIAKISPKLQTSFGHKLKLKFDGKILKGIWGSNKINLQSIDRGTHSISVIVVDKKGKKLKQSKAITFHLLRFSRLMGR